MIATKSLHRARGTNISCPFFYSFYAKAVFFLTIFIIHTPLASQSELPNILWIVSEDNSPYLGCYGDTLANTPNLDQLAREGHLYTHAYANAPVCAPARNTIITGVYANSNGNQHMRSNYPLSDSVRFFPEYLKAEGYYCTNKSKKDYNTSTADSFWNESSLKADYKNRDEGQPFFHVVNISISHESSLHRYTPDSLLKHRPEEMVLPPYHPDTEENRHDWAQYYDRISLMDKRVGEILKELNENGETENTIVFYFSDHGGVLARSKRFLYETGTRVPFIVRIPEKFKKFRPSEVGTQVNRLISFVDLAPTMLSLVNSDIPSYMQGRAFLGESQSTEHEYVFMFRDRMDASYDLSRAVRSKKYRYIRNYLPYEIYGQHIDYLWKAPSVGSWESVCENGDCDSIQSAFWREKPVEELYDTEVDPWEVNNLAEDSSYIDILKEMREANRDWILEVKDTGFIPEQMMSDLIHKKGMSVYDLMRSNEINLQLLLDHAESASDRNDVTYFMEGLISENSVMQFWSAVGLRMNYRKIGDNEVPMLIQALSEVGPDTKVLISEILYLMNREEWQDSITEVLWDEQSPMARARALSFIREFSIDNVEIRKVISETYAKFYIEDRFRYDLLASASLISGWDE